MSGVTGDNPYRASGVIAAASAGGLSWQAVETGSTMTAEAGNGYWIDTTSNACTITLPASPSNGDEVMFVDYARNWGTNAITIDSNGSNYQGDPDTYAVEYSTDGQAVHVVYSDATQGWIPTLDKAVDDVPAGPTTQNGIFGFGNTGSRTATTNLITSAGVCGSDVAGVGTARDQLSACEFGMNKAIFGFGTTGSDVGMTNLVSNTGVVATDVAAVGSAETLRAACTYGSDKGIFAYGYTGPVTTRNLVSNVGVVASDESGAGTARGSLMATEYSADKAKGIFGYGYVSGDISVTNLVSTVGVVGSDVTGVGTARHTGAACGYGGDKGIFGYGQVAGSGSFAMTNLVSNVGVVGTDVSGVGTVRKYLAACEYGGDKGIFGFGNGEGPSYTKYSVTNLVSNAGVVATDTAGVGTAKTNIAAGSYN